jgi:hypothetical protein
MITMRSFFAIVEFLGFKAVYDRHFKGITVPWRSFAMNMSSECNI